MSYRPHPYTHRTALLGNHLGLPVPRCNGELELATGGTDVVQRDGRRVYRLISVYHCAACGAAVSIARETIDDEDSPVDAESLAWELLNAYRPLPSPDRLAAELAHAFELPTNGSSSDDGDRSNG
ncbi:MAG TPA: hypothetical protein VN719_09560 [Gemmatimonadales bacterium]|nr:hypothetical protein [Gemmatimonadales bacterium]